MIYFAVLYEEDASGMTGGFYGMGYHKYGLPVTVDLFKGLKLTVGGL